MSSFSFDDILFTEPIPVKNNLIWIWHADKIPPHIGISVVGNYFSLKVSGKDVELSTERILSLANTNSIPLICIDLEFEISVKNVRHVFEKYDKAIVGKSTCLTPITKILGLQDVNQLSELLHKLTQNNTLGKVYGLNLSNEYSALPDYTPSDIQQRLKQLSDAQRNANIS